MKKDKYQIILIIIFVLAILLRIFYISKFNIAQFQFDFGVEKNPMENLNIDYENLYKNFSKDYNEARHINYIMHLYTFGALPTEIIGQFYHPPMHHFLMASWLKCVDLFSENPEFKLESMQFISLLYSVIILVTLYKILKELEIENKYKILPMLLFGFYPLYIYFSGSLNNDQLVTMFGMICLLYLMKWYKSPNIKNTLAIAFSIGLGLMTKSSMYVMMIPAIYVFFKKLIEQVNSDQKVGKLLLELLIVTIISGVLGFWFQIFNFMRGTYALGIIAPYESLSIANESIWARFGISKVLKMSGVNIWNYLLYSSLNFGLVLEYSTYIKVMVIFVITLVFDAIYFMIKNIKEEKILMITFISWWAFYFFLNIQMPYTCSMHSRYMLVPISIASIVIAKGMQEEKNKYLKAQAFISTIVTCVMSVGLFMFVI